MTKTSAKSSATSKTTRAPRAKKSVAAPAIVVNNIETIEASDDGLEALIASLNSPDEVVEEKAVIAAAVIDDAALESAVLGAEATEATMAVATPDGVIESGAAPTGDASDVVDTTEVVAEAAEKPAKVKKEKKAAIPRKHYSDKTERLKDKLGAGLAEYSVLTLADAGVSDDELVKVMENTMGIIKAMNKKQTLWAVKFIEFLAGKKASMSEVTSRILTVLARDGYVTTGTEGNMMKDLVARPYSIGAARAMGGNNIGMLSDLKLIIADGKGKYVANPDSLLLIKAHSMMTPAAA